VQWQTEVVDGQYIKKTDSAGNTLSENNWVWSPQGLIAMHYPEMWGFVQFSTQTAGATEVAFTYDPIEDDKQLLRELYYAQRTYRMRYGTYTEDIDALELDHAVVPSLRLWASENQFEARLTSSDGRVVSINHEGRTGIE
jgi:hypothetical protein